MVAVVEYCYHSTHEGFFILLSLEALLGDVEERKTGKWYIVRHKRGGSQSAYL